MLRPGAEIEIFVERPVAGGRMLARHDGQVVLVSGTLPGERVRARVERGGRDVAHARTMRVLEPHVDRRGPADPAPCGGNVYVHIAYERQLALKSEVLVDAFRRIGRIELEEAPAVMASPEQGYRMRARLHAAGGGLGFFREGTHDSCDPGQTGQLLPETIDVVRRLSATLRARRLTGVVSVELAENCPATERAIHVEAREPDVRRLRALAVDGVTGLSIGGTSTAGTVTAHGRAEVTDEVTLPSVDGAGPPGSIRLRRNVRTFFQGNRFLLAPLLHRVIGEVGTGGVVDLYAGAGLFAVALAAAGNAPVIAVERDAVSAEDLRFNATPYGDALVPHQVSVEEFFRDYRPADGATILVDPPRTGLSREALAGLIAAGARRVVYVSCDPATLARDCRGLTAAGYRLAHVEALDLFPNTAHLEILASLSSG